MTGPEFLASFYRMSQEDAEELVREMRDISSLNRLAENRMPPRAERTPPASPEDFCGAE
jgi:hypothetical protein